MEYIALLDSLEQDPEQGTPLGNRCFKIRIAITSKGKGKSGGARVIIHVAVTNEVVFLLDIYDKSEQENISEKEWAKHLRKFFRRQFWKRERKAGKDLIRKERQPRDLTASEMNKSFWQILFVLSPYFLLVSGQKSPMPN